MMTSEWFRVWRRRLLFLTACCLTQTSSAADRAPSFARTLFYYTGLQGRVLWIDATANLARTTTREGVAEMVNRARTAGFTTLVVDVKPVSGQVVYRSTIAERLRSWQGRPVPDFDVLQAFVEEGHKAGLEVAASLNVFSEGHKYYRVGKAYAKRDWQATVLTVRRFLRANDGSDTPVRADDDPEEAGVPIVYGPDGIISGATTVGKNLIATIEHTGVVSAIVDTALLGDEPLGPPETGHMVSFSSERRTWAAAHLRPGDKLGFRVSTQLLPIADAPSERIAAFVNPLHPEARSYTLSLIREVAAKYPVDAIVMDRMRYPSIFADFSPISRAAFERWLGRSVARWPQDILEANPVPGEPVIRGPLFKPWLEFRARVIKEYLAEAAAIVRGVRPETRIAAYVGSWFASYYGVGVNWASERYPVLFTWATPSYGDTGYVEHLDWLTTGCYYGIPTRAGARALGLNEGATVETAAALSTRVTANAVPVYAGLYALNYEQRPDDFAQAVDTAIRRSAGVMIFDVSHVYTYGWWPVLEKALQGRPYAPHAYLDLVSQLRTAHDAVTAPGAVDVIDRTLPVVPYQSGGG